MCQIPSPSPDTKNQSKGPTERQADQVTNSPECSCPRLIFELVNVIIRSLDVELGLTIEIKTPKEKVRMDLVSLPEALTGRLWCLWKIVQEWDAMIYESPPHTSRRRRKGGWGGVAFQFPFAVSVQIVKIMQITILAPLLEENIIKLCSKYFVCFSNYSHVTVNINSCYSV